MSEYGTLRERRCGFRLRTNGASLKRVGCGAMLFYTLSMSVFRQGLIHADEYAIGALSAAMSADAELMNLSGLAVVCQLIGGLGVPIFAFLLVEGFIHTSNYGRYLGAVLLCGIVSEIPYDLAMSGQLFTMDGQNVMFTYGICLVMLYGLNRMRQKTGFRWLLARLVVMLAAVLWASILRCAFGLATVLLCGIYICRRVWIFQ